MTPDRRRFLRDLTALLGVPLLLLIGIIGFWHPWRRVYDAPPGSSVSRVVVGEWDWAGADSFCVANPHTISFSADRTVMIIRQVKPWTDGVGVQHRLAVYDLHGASRHHVRGTIRGEYRKTPGGETVAWDLVLRSPDTYSWHRTDWPSWQATALVRRCGPNPRTDR